VAFFTIMYTKFCCLFIKINVDHCYKDEAISNSHSNNNVNEIKVRNSPQENYIALAIFNAHA